MEGYFVIRFHQNAVIYDREDGIWFQSNSLVVFQHADISTMTELKQVILFNSGGGFREIKKIDAPTCQGFYWLRLLKSVVRPLHVPFLRAPHLLLLLMSALRNRLCQTHMEISNSKSDSDYVASSSSSSDSPQDNECIPNTPVGGRPR
ncbi:hypothetical protein PIB30_005473 [Stylosanthes scabra]|uniref:Uncharacterized protein n=1 Tax=Stylosanthes scabra TaxID=79078 RepID=A0ABU6Z4I8_9FABA|nr:hypothetical protein [Stylosanthes scabra]